MGRRYVQGIQLLKALDFASVQSSATLRAHPLRGAMVPRWALTLHGRWRIECTFEGDTRRVEEVSNHYGD